MAYTNCRVAANPANLTNTGEPNNSGLPVYLEVIGRISTVNHHAPFFACQSKRQVAQQTLLDGKSLEMVTPLVSLDVRQQLKEVRRRVEAQLKKQRRLLKHTPQQRNSTTPLQITSLNIPQAEPTNILKKSAAEISGWRTIQKEGDEEGSDVEMGDEEDQLRGSDSDISDDDDELVLLNPSAALPAPHLEPLDQPLSPLATALAKNQAYHAYYHPTNIERRTTKMRSSSGSVRRLKNADRQRRLLKSMNKRSRIEDAAVAVVRPTQEQLNPIGTAAMITNAVHIPSTSLTTTTRPFSTSRMIEWKSDLARLKGQAEQGGLHHPEYTRLLEKVLEAIEKFEDHPEFTVGRLAETGLYLALRPFRHVNGGSGPGVPSLKHRVAALCSRLRKKVEDSDWVSPSLQGQCA